MSENKKLFNRDTGKFMGESNVPKIIKRKEQPSDPLLKFDDSNEDVAFNDLNDIDYDIDDLEINIGSSNVIDTLDTSSFDDLDYVPKKKKIIKSSVEEIQPSNEITKNKANIEYGSFTAKLSKENITYAKILKATDKIKDISKFIDSLITEHRNTQNTNE